MREALVAVACAAVLSAACAPATERGATGRGAQRAADGKSELAVFPNEISNPPARSPLAFPAVVLVVLSKTNGDHGAVVVRSGDQQILIDEPYGAARIDADGKLEPITYDPAAVRKQFGEALSAQPLRPTTFLLHFQENTDRFTSDSAVRFEQVFTEIKRHPAAEITVTGHADRAGSPQHNDRLSQARARRVRDELIRRGVPPVQIVSVAGRGERELLIATPDNIAEPRNRRVEIGVR